MATGCKTPASSTEAADEPQSGSNPASSPTSNGDTVDTTAETGDGGDAGREDIELRLATYNASLHGEAPGELAETLADPSAEAPQRVAAILQRIRPDVVLINEFDRTPEADAVERFRRHFLLRSQRDQRPIRYPHVFYPPVNTGVHSGHDLNNDDRVVSTIGKDGYAGDALGYGAYPGQYGMVVLSKYPIQRDHVRSFRTFRWRSMPDNLLPESWYDPAEFDVLRLSSKTHVDVPVQIGSSTLHLLASHPTPPAFGGPESRNERRNHDEIQFWHDYLTPEASDYIVDDAGMRGGLPEEASFAVLGDLNADPADGAKRSRRAISALLEHPRTVDPEPTSRGGPAAARRDEGVNAEHAGDPALDTADFGDDETGNLRVDYVLPSSDLEVRDAGVFWPAPGEPGADLVDVSDHRLVWVDVAVPVD